MLVRLKRKTNIIQTPENFATLERVTNDGYFVYRMRYLIDPIKAVKENAFKVKMELTQVPKTKPIQPVFENFNPDETIRKLLFRETFIKNTNNSEENNPVFFSFVSDITKSIPKDINQSLAQTTFIERPIIKKIKQVRPVLVSDLNRENISVPVLEVNLNQPNNEEEYQLLESDGLGNLGEKNTEVSEISNRLLMELGIDPSSFVGEASNSFVSARKVSSGLQMRHGSNFERRQKTKELLPKSDILIKTFLSSKNVTNQTQLSQDSYVNTSVEENEYTVEVQETLFIPIIDIIYDTFTVNFELIDNVGLIVETYDETINHAQNVFYKRFPVKPPEFKVSNLTNRSGFNLLEIKQIDPNATKVFIYKKEFVKCLTQINKTYELIDEVELTPESDVFRYADRQLSINPIIYRVVAANEETVGAEYSTFVLPGKNVDILSTEKIDKKTNFISLDYEITDNSIVIIVEDGSYGPISYQLMRRQLSIFEKDYKAILEPQLIESTTAETIFSDTNVQKGRIYEYALKLFYPDGSEELSSNTLLIKYAPVTKNIAVAALSPPELIQNENGEQDVRFNIERRIIENDPDLIKKFIEEQGLLGEFQEDVIANKEALQELFSVGVKRLNINSGEYEEFGIIPSLNFSDRQFGSAVNVSPLQEKTKYKYEITLYARNVETLFPQLEKNVLDANGREYKFKPSKWRHPITLNEGNIVAKQTLAKNYANSELSFGSVVDVQTVEVETEQSFPTIKTASFRQIRKNANLIEWAVQGDQSKIDHFIIVMNIMGIKTIIGKAHALNDDSLFSYMHILDNEETGQVLYEITSVYYDFSRGATVLTNPVVF